MADIETTINAMPKKDTSPTPPDLPVIEEEVLTAATIQNIAKDLAQPWLEGNTLCHCARRYGVRGSTIKKIYAALKAKQAADAPAQIEEVP